MAGPEPDLVSLDHRSVFSSLCCACTIAQQPQDATQRYVDPIRTVACLVVDFIENFSEEMEAQQPSLSFHVLHSDHAALRGRCVRSDENLRGSLFPSQSVL